MSLSQGTDKWDRYNAIDSLVAFEVYESTFPSMRNRGLQDIYDQTIALYPVLLYMGQRGFYVDHERLHVERERVANQILELNNDLYEMCGFELNANSSTACCKYLYDELGNTPYVSPKTGRPTTDDKALTRLYRKGVKQAKVIQNIRNLSKLKSTYLDISFDNDGRMRCSYNPRGTKFGRLSSSKTIFNRGMNMQNLDPRFKGFLSADPGYILVEMDKRQAEWVVTAFASGDENMMHVCQSGVDPHAYTGHKISGLPLDMVALESKIVGHASDRNEIERLRRENIPDIFELATFLPEIFSIRQAGKKSNHGLNYRMGPSRFALENEMMERDAAPIVEGYRESYPGLPRWWNKITAKLRKDRTLSNCFNRHQQFLGSVDDYSVLMEATAFIPQSTVGDLVNRALISAFNDPRIKHTEFLTQTHDSITAQIPVNTTDYRVLAEELLLIKDYMNPTMVYDDREFSIETDMKVGYNWGSYAKDNVNGMYEVDFSNEVDELAGIIEKRHGEIIG